jgi:hypothetical protein
MVSGGGGGSGGKGPPLRLLIGAVIFGIAFIMTKFASFACCVTYRCLPRFLSRRLSSLISSPMTGGKPTLIGIPFSHYVEKIRWTLELCGNQDRHYREICNHTSSLYSTIYWIVVLVCFLVVDV